MSYNYIDDRDSPNFTANSQVPRTYGVNRTYSAIAIHWWGDPNQNPSAEGIVNHLTNPNAGVSAHFVATGTGRRAWQLVNFADASWATNSANPSTISIECDPRCRDEDYDVVAEVISQIRDAFGDIPLVPHRQFVSTACPGNYDLGRLDRLARTKDGSGAWGTVTNKNGGNIMNEEAAKGLYRFGLFREPENDQVWRGWQGKNADEGMKSFMGSSEWKNNQNKVNRFNGVNAENETNKTKVAQLTTDTEAKGKRIEQLEKELKEALEKPSTGSFTESDRNTLNGIQKAVQWLTERFKAIFNS